MFDTTLTTANGKRQQVHFAGVYTIIEKSLNTEVQIRTSGSPKYKGIKMQRVKDIENLRVYKFEGDYLTNLDYTLLSYVEKVRENPNIKHVYISSYENQIHFAVTYRKHPKRKNKNLTIDVINNYYSEFLEEVKIINELSNLGNY